MKSIHVPRLFRKIALAVICIQFVMALFMMASTPRAKSVQAIADRIISLGGLVEFESASASGANEIDPDAKSRLYFLKPVLGVDPTLQIKKVRLASKFFSDSDFLELCRLNQLESLDLDCPQLTDAAMKGLARQSHLQYLSLRGTSITDVGAQYLKDCTDLQSLMLGCTNVGDGAMRAIGPLPKLESLELVRTQVGDGGIQCLSRNTSLRFLSISGTRITDRGLYFLPKGSKLATLDIQDTATTDEGICWIADLPHLENLMLSSRLSDKGLSKLAQLTSLRRLCIPSPSPRVTDDGLAHLRKLSNLQELWLYNTNVTLDGLRRIRELQRLTRIDITSRILCSDDATEVAKMFPNSKVELLSGGN